MSVKIRLARGGKKKKPFYSINVADARAPRDGRYIEKIGTYNPNTNPATVVLDVDRAVYWLQNGAQPTDTCRAILSYKGVLYKNHLLKGVAKGALTQEQADKKFEAWLQEKESKVTAKVDGLAKAKADAAKAALAAEADVNAKRAEAIVAKNTPEVEEAPAEEVAEEAPAAEAPAEDNKEEAAE